MALRYPRYGGPGGLPLNFELLLRDLEQHFGATLDWWELPLALFRGRQFMDQWRTTGSAGPARQLPEQPATNHVLAVYGWDLRDASGSHRGELRGRDRSAQRRPVTRSSQNNGARAALRVLPRAPKPTRAADGPRRRRGSGRRAGQDDRRHRDARGLPRREQRAGRVTA